MENKINITVADGVQEIVIREGRALDQIQSKQVVLVGDISTPSEYYRTRPHTVDPDKAVVIYNRKNCSIELQCDAANPLGAIVKGSLEKSDEIKDFGINSQKTFSQTELVKLIRFNKRFFADRDEVETFLTKLVAFKFASTIDSANNVKDNRGNHSNSFAKKVESDIPTSIKFAMPLFKNASPVEFISEIVLDVAENTARFWFESVDLETLIQSTIDAEFDKSKAAFEGTTIAIVNQ